MKFFKKEIKKTVFLWVLIPLGCGCSELNEFPKKPAYSLIEHIDTADIQARSFELPHTKEFEYNTDSLSFEPGGYYKFIPLDWEEGNPGKLESGVYESFIDFSIQEEKNKQKFEDRILHSTVLSKKQETNAKFNELIRVSGNWKIENKFLTNLPLSTDSISDPFHKRVKSDFWFSKNLNLLMNLNVINDGQLRVKISFKPDNKSQTHTHQDQELPGIGNLAGVFFSGDNSSIDKGLNGIAVLINEKTELFLGKIYRSELSKLLVLNRTLGSQNKVKKNSRFPLLTLRDIRTISGKAIEHELKVSFIDGQIQIFLDGILRKSLFLPLLPGKFGLASSGLTQTNFNEFNYIDLPSFTKFNQREAGFYFCENEKSRGFAITLAANGFLKLAYLGEKPIKGFWVPLITSQPLTRLSLFLNEDQFSIYVNNRLEMVIKKPQGIPHNPKKYSDKQESLKPLYQSNSPNRICSNGKPDSNGRSWGILKVGSNLNFKNTKLLKLDYIKNKKKARGVPILLEDFLSLKRILKADQISLSQKFLVKKLKLDQTTRNAIVAQVPSQLKFQLKMPRQPYLSFAIATIPKFGDDNLNVDFSIEVQADGKTEKIFSYSLAQKYPFFWNDELFFESILHNSLTKWREFRVDLSTYQNRSVTLSFNTNSIRNTFALWGNPTILSKREAEQFNVILVSLDTLRADHLSSYGYKRNTSPNIDLIAKGGVRFHNTIAQAPWTFASHASMLTSQYPSSIGFNFEGWLSGKVGLPTKVKTLAEILKAQGYLTAGFVGGVWLSDEFSWSRGFSSYNEKWFENLEYAYQDVENWMFDHKDDRFFLFFHTYEIHDYIPVKNKFYTHDKFYTDQTQEAIDLYDGNIRFVDTFMGQLFNLLKRLDLERKTLLIITSDHGEGFYEHGLIGHENSLYDELLRVPLIFYLPERLPQNKIIDSQVRLIDILPTILDILSISTDNQFEGKSLNLFFEGKTEERLAFSEWASETNSLINLFPTSLRTNKYKLVKFLENNDRAQALNNLESKYPLWVERVRNNKPKDELFNLVENPDENLKHILNDQALLTKYSELIREHKRARAKKWASIKSSEDEHEVNLDPSVKQRLQALGYLQ